MDAPKQTVLRVKTNREKENVYPPSALPRLTKRSSNQQITPVRKVSGSQPTLGPAALRTQVDTLRAENAKLRKEHQRELSKAQEKSVHSEARVQELVREKLARESEHAEIEREQRTAIQREAALRTALERSETALRQLNERSSKLNGAERKLEDLERIHTDEKRKLKLDISSLQSQLDLARTTLISHTSRQRLSHDSARIAELEDQAQVYERRIEVYDVRVKAYKERVRVAEERALVAEDEAESSAMAQDSANKFALAYGRLFERLKDQEREIQETRRALKGKSKEVEYLEEDLELAKAETDELKDEVQARQLSVVEVDELWELIQQGQMEVRRLESLAGPSDRASSSALEMELAQLRAECAALREEQESMEQDLVVAAMDAEEHTRRAIELEHTQAECNALRAELARHHASQTRLTELQSAYGQLQSSHNQLVSQHSELESKHGRQESEHKRLAAEYETYKSKMEATALSVAEHEARAVLLNGSLARERALREQVEALRASEGESERLKQAEARVVQLEGVETGLKRHMTEMMEALDRVDRFEEAHDALVSEICQLGLGDAELDRLQSTSERILATSNAEPKMRYLEEVKAEMDRLTQKFARAEWERDQARKENAQLRAELGAFRSRTLSASTSPTVAEMRALGLGIPPRRPNSQQQTRQISRALSYAIDVEGVVPALVEEEDEGREALQLF